MNLPNTIALWIAGIFLAAVIGYVVYSGWRKIRNVGTFFLLFAIMMAMYGGSKGFYRAVEFPRTDMSAAYLMDNGSYVSSNDVHLAFSASTFMPPDAEIYLDYIPAGSTNDADWTTYTNATLAAFPNPLDFNFENAISNRWACYTTWTPGTPEVTNGIVRIGWMLPMDGATNTIVMLRTGVVTRPSARSYVQDGLIGMWDGIENAGWGVNDPNATVWKELVGTFFTSSTQRGNFSFADDAAIFDGTVQINTAYRWALPSVTVETVFDITSLPSYLPIVDCTSVGGWTIKREPNRSTPFFAARDANGNTYRFINLSWAVGNVYAYSFQASSSGIIGYDKGVKFSDSSFGSIKNQTSGYLYIGNTAVNGSQRFVGKIRNLRIYSRALSADEVAHNYAIDKVRFNLPNP